MLLPNTNAHKGKDCPYFLFSLFFFSVLVQLVNKFKKGNGKVMARWREKGLKAGWHGLNQKTT